MTTYEWLALAGLLIIVGLAAYAGTLWARVWRRQRKKSSQEAERNERLAGDVQFLARSLLNDQVPVIEGAIRIKVLLDNYSGPRREDLDVQVFESIYDSTAHIPTHQGWKDLPKPERDIHLEQMETLERIHKQEVDRAARQLSQDLTGR